MNYYVYILSNNFGNMLYIGVTNDLRRRIYQHKSQSIDGFTKRYNVNKLIYYECFGDITQAIKREKQLKSWSRLKKDNLIRKINPNYKELKTD